MFSLNKLGGLGETNLNSIKNVVGKYFGMDRHVFSVKFGGSPLKKLPEIVYFELSSNVYGEASFCSIKFALNCYTPDNDEIVWYNELTNVSEGSKFEISAGYTSASTGEKYEAIIFVGYVYSCSLSVENRTSYFEFFGMDGKIWLMNNKTTQFKTDKKKFSEIVKDILNQHPSIFLSTKIEISNEPEASRTELYQKDDSDFNYLVKLSERIGCHFFVNKGNCYFISFSTDTGNSLTFEPMGWIDESAIISKINFKSNIVGIPKSVSAKFYLDEKFKESKDCKFTPSKQLGSGKIAHELTNNISGEINVSDNIMDSEQYAKFITSGEYSEKSKNFANLEIVCKFIPDLDIGSKVTVSGFGKLIDNNYILTSVYHKYDGQEFKTTITLSTDAIPR